MKKFISLMMSAIFALAMLVVAACGGAGTSDVSDSSTSSTSSTSSSSSENEPAERTDKEFYLGMYGIAPEGKDSAAGKFEEALKSDTYNVFMLGDLSEEKMDRYCQMIYDAGKKFWWGGIHYVWNWEDRCSVREDAYKRLNDLRNMMANKPWYDAFLGLHVDEPLLSGMTLENLKRGAEVVHFVFPEKRFWVNFAAYAFNDDLATSTDRMTREAGEYITDVSFDLYGVVDETFMKCWNTMIDMFKDDNKYFWGIPMTMSYAGRTTEQQSIDHVREIYKLVQEVDGGAGLVFYTGGTFSWELEQIGNIGFFDLLTSEEDFKSWEFRKKPWSLYYERFADSYKPWTNLQAEFEKMGKEVTERNKERVEKIDTAITVEKNAEFEYNGSGLYPKPYPEHLGYTYRFNKKGEEIFFEEPPVEIGEYTVTITLPESKFRKKKTVKVDFSIVESSKTLIDKRDITESYGGENSWISINRTGLSYSFDGETYLPYEKNAQIDITDKITRTGYSNCLWFKEGEKRPFLYAIKSYKEVMVFDFEFAEVDLWSTFVLASNRVHDGIQAAYCDKEKAPYEGIQHFYYNNSSLPVSPASGGKSLADAYYFEFWVYSEEEVEMGIEFSVEGWIGTRANQKFVVPAGQWTKLSFDLNDRSNKEAAKLDNIIMMSVLTDRSVNYYIDNMVAITL